MVATHVHLGFLAQNLDTNNKCAFEYKLNCIYELVLFSLSLLLKTNHRIRLRGFRDQHLLDSMGEEKGVISPFCGLELYLIIQVFSLQSLSQWQVTLTLLLVYY